MTNLVHSGIRHARYCDAGRLESWWRREKGDKPEYVEKFYFFKDASFAYNVDFCDPAAHPDTDGWPLFRSAPKARKRRPQAEELI